MTLSGTNTYLVTDGSGDVAIVDPGPDLAAHVNALLARAQALGQVTTVLVTHRHADHLPAALPVCARTGATLVGHALLPGVQRAVGDHEPVFGNLRAIATPGHTRDSLCFWDPTNGALFTGDLVAGSGTVVVDDTPGALADYVASLERLLTLRPRTIYPGHGPLVADAVTKLNDYVEHRRGREQQVVSALAEHGPRTVDELVGLIYVDVAPNLAPMAARNVRACLDKLAAEGRAAEDGQRWTLIG
jgi:glyoxylase-like metal-dependent hydrolase (beta-lactamase superfamily II)